MLDNVEYLLNIGCAVGTAVFIGLFFVGLCCAVSLTIYLMLTLVGG